MIDLLLAFIAGCIGGAISGVAANSFMEAYWQRRADNHLTETVFNEDKTTYFDEEPLS